MAFAPAMADTNGNVIIGIHYWTEVYDGMGQSYNISIEPGYGPVANAYIILIIHPDTDIFAVNHSDGLICSEHQQYALTVFCSIDNLEERQTLGAHGTIIGPGDDGAYAILRVGTAANGSAGQGWLLDADYYPGGSIPAPSNIGATHEPSKETIYLPVIRR